MLLPSVFNLAGCWCTTGTYWVRFSMFFTYFKGCLYWSCGSDHLGAKMCGQDCGKRVICEAFRSLMNFVDSSEVDWFVAWEDVEVILASSSCSSSMRISRSCVSLASANRWRSPGRSLRLGLSGDCCRCSLSSGLLALTYLVRGQEFRKMVFTGWRESDHMCSLLRWSCRGSIGRRAEWIAKINYPLLKYANWLEYYWPLFDCRQKSSNLVLKFDKYFCCDDEIVERVS